MGDCISLSFTDTGSGMDDVILSKIFDPFFTTKGDQGTGLGLSQVYGLLNGCDGEIRVESEVDKGTVFTAYLPRYVGNIAHETETAGQIDVQGHENILLVDDEVDLQHLFEKQLQRFGYHVHLAKNAEQAMQVLGNNPIDLMITDVVMPGESGYQLIARALKRFPNLKVQVISGYNDGHPSGDIDEQYMTQLLIKPFKVDELLKRVRTLLNEGDERGGEQS